MKNIALLTIFLALISTNAYSADNKVLMVYACGNDVGIQIENDGWVVAKESTIGEKRVNRIFSMALALWASQNSVGYMDDRGTTNWCGIQNVRNIGVLQIKLNGI